MQFWNIVDFMNYVYTQLNNNHPFFFGLQLEKAVEVVSETDTNMHLMFEILKKARRVKVENLILNRNSFAQTVENLFVLSFLVKDGRVRIDIDEAGSQVACILLDHIQNVFDLSYSYLCYNSVSFLLQSLPMVQVQKKSRVELLKPTNSCSDLTLTIGRCGNMSE